MLALGEKPFPEPFRPPQSLKHIGPGLSRGPRGKRPGTNWLSHGTTYPL